MKLTTVIPGLYRFWCPGCDCAHTVDKNVWTVDVESTTIRPSILVHPHKTFIDHSLVGDALLDPGNVTETFRCHSFVTGGRIEFLGDSTHSLAGRTVDLPEWPL